MMRFLSCREAALALGAAALCSTTACLAQGNAPQPGEPPAKVEPTPSPPDRGKSLNTLAEVGPWLTQCLQMPPEEVARPGMEITVRLSFTRDGEILGEPRFTFSTPGIRPETRAVYQRAVADMLSRCTPLPFTKELGGAIAGRPFSFRIVETRKEKKAEHSNVASDRS
jgi:hypothetical protein